MIIQIKKNLLWCGENKFQFIELRKVEFEVELWRQAKNIWNLF